MSSEFKLRAFDLGDIDRLVSILNDSDVNQFLSSKIPFPYTIDDACWWTTVGSQSGFIKAIEIDGQLAGCIGVNPGEFEYSRSGEIGYWLAREYWSRGWMSQVVKDAIKHIFDTTELVRIHAAVFSGNVGSLKVLGKAGFHEECVQSQAVYKDGQFYDCHILSLLRNS